MAWEPKTNVRGPAGYNATGAAEDDLAISNLIKETAGPTKTKEALAADFAEQEKVAPLNERFLYRDTPTYDPAFPMNGIFDNADGAFVWKQMQVSGGYGGEIGDGQPISYFKAVGGSINHTGPGNLDAFWTSVQHRGPREVGLFIGDLTSRRGGNAYGGHTRVVVEPDEGYGAPLYQVSWSHEIFVGVERQAGQSAYGELIDIQGRFAASAGIHIGAQFHTGAKDRAGTSPVIFGINLDSTLASPHATAINVQGVWGAGLALNGNNISGVTSVTGQGVAGSRYVNIGDHALLNNGRHLAFKDSVGVARPVFTVTATDNTRFIAAGAAKQWEFYDSTNATQVARITGGGRADFSTGGVTSKYTSAATGPGFLTNGHIEVWRDTATNTDYLVVHSNGTVKKVAIA